MTTISSNKTSLITKRWQNLGLEKKCNFYLFGETFAPGHVPNKKHSLPSLKFNSRARSNLTSLQFASQNVGDSKMIASWHSQSTNQLCCRSAPIEMCIWSTNETRTWAPPKNPWQIRPSTHGWLPMRMFFLICIQPAIVVKPYWSLGWFQTTRTIYYIYIYMMPKISNSNGCVNECA